MVKDFGGAKKLDDAFTAYWGLGESVDCSIQNECERPKCSELKRPSQSQDYEQASMVLTSMVNFNKVHCHYLCQFVLCWLTYSIFFFFAFFVQYCVRLYEALNGANIDFATIQVAIQQTFYPGTIPSNFNGIQGLNGVTAAVVSASGFLLLPRNEILFGDAQRYADSGYRVLQLPQQAH